MLGKESQGQQEIRFLLESNNINFKQEITFQDLKLINKLRFDFGIYNDNNELIRLIEFDGEQHYKNQNFFQDLQYIKNNDKIKNEYCKNNNISLVRIPYWEKDKITLEMLLGDKYLI